jgi:hypothetical protein
MIEKLRNYVWVDYRTRWRNDLLSVALSVCSYMICLALGVGDKAAVRISMGLLVISVAVTTVLYCVRPIDKLNWRVGGHTFRRLVWQFPVVILAVLSNASAPSVEAGVIDTRLRLAVHGEPTQGKIEKAVRIVNQARDNNIQASASVIAQVGQKILGSAALPHMQRTAVEAANQFATYRSSLQSLPLTVTHIDTLTATPTDPAGPPVTVNVGCAEARNGSEGRSGAIFVFSGFTVGNCSDVVISPTKPEVLHLDNVDSKNVTFVNSTLIYNGGKLKLENVRFVNCTFRVSAEYSNDQNVLQLLRAALSGERINLELPAAARL